MELSEGGGVERPRGDADDAEPGEPVAHFTRGLVRERHGQDRRGRKRAGGDLVRDPPRDRRRLAGSGAGKDADGTAYSLDGSSLLDVQTGEDPVRVHRERLGDAPAGFNASATFGTEMRATIPPA
jgi:hypothetical protein